MGTQAVAASHGGGGGGGGGGGRQKAQGLQGFSAQSPIYGFDEFLHTAIPPSTVAGGGAEMTLEGFLMKVRATAVDGGGDNGDNLGRGAVSGGYVGRAGPAQQLSEAALQTLTRKRGVGTVAAAAAVEEVAEKTVERRQKRMIKNRESAARSRARKQAYTNELENKVSRLEEENERLKRQKELEPVIHFVPQPEPKHQLRRTSSALF